MLRPATAAVSLPKPPLSSLECCVCGTSRPVEAIVPSMQEDAASRQVPVAEVMEASWWSHLPWRSTAGSQRGSSRDGCDLSLVSHGCRVVGDWKWPIGLLNWAFVSSSLAKNRLCTQALAIGPTRAIKQAWKVCGVCTSFNEYLEPRAEVEPKKARS